MDNLFNGVVYFSSPALVYHNLQPICLFKIYLCSLLFYFFQQLHCSRCQFISYLHLDLLSFIKRSSRYFIINVFFALHSNFVNCGLDHRPLSSIDHLTKLIKLFLQNTFRYFLQNTYNYIWTYKYDTTCNIPQFHLILFFFPSTLLLLYIHIYHKFLHFQIYTVISLTFPLLYIHHDQMICHFL